MEEAMEEEDLRPQRQKPKPKDLDIMSIEALEEYIATLEAEIARARAAIAAKSSHRQAAESFFKR
ncbi:MAG: DUF1192 family protein [Alphaproteobacteria bacterium]